MFVNIYNINSKMVLAGSAMLFGICLGSVGAAFSATVTPHKAFYEMQLGNADQNSNVQAVVGRSAFTLGRDCSGWQSNEDYVIEFIVSRSASEAVFKQKKILMATPR
jgi:hypothetical protein